MPSEPGMVGRAARGSRGRRWFRSTATRCSARRRFPSARGDTASGRTTPAPGTRAPRGRTARRRRPATSPTGRRRFRWLSFLMPASCVVAGLRHRGVRLVRAGGRHAFVLVVDLRRRAERLLEPTRAEQRRRPPQPVDLAHRLGDLDLAFGATPPAAISAIGNSGARSSGPTGCMRARVQHRRRRHGQVGRDVVPVARQLALVEQELRR